MDRSHKHENGRGGLLKSTLIWQEIVHIWYTPKACKYCYTLKVAINEGVGQGRHPVPQDCRVAPLDQNPQSPPEVPNCLAFLLASVTGQGGPQLPHLPLCHLVSATK